MNENDVSKKFHHASITRDQSEVIFCIWKGLGMMITHALDFDAA